MSLEPAVSTVHRPVDETGRAIGPLRLARAMLVNILGGVSILMALAVLWPNAAITAVFMREELGASNTLIGLNFTLLTLATVTALPGAWLFSRLRRRRLIWVLLTTLARMFMFGAALVALLADHGEHTLLLTWVFIICLFVVNAGSVFTSPGWWSWMADLIPDSIRGRFFGRRYRWMLLGQSVIIIAAATMLDLASTESGRRLMYFIIFTAAAVLAVVDPLLFLLVPEPVRPDPPRRSFREMLAQYLEPVRDRPFCTVLVGAGLYGLCFNMPWVFLPLFLRGEEVGGEWIGGHAPLILLSLVMVVFSVGTAIAANQWGRLADRIGHRIVWILGSLAFFTHISYFFLNEHNYVLIALANAALFGLIFSVQPVAVQNLVLAMAPASAREFYQSIFQTVTALAMAMGPLLGGYLADRFRIITWLKLPSGQHACYIHLQLAISFVGILVSVLIMTRVPDLVGTRVRPWLGRLASGDLWRLTWNLSVLGTASSITRRVRALRRISPSDGNLMLPDVHGALDDPDAVVRHEALLTLGRIGTPEALDLLRWYLYEPDPAVRARCIEAFGRTREPDRSVVLQRALRDPDHRVRRAAAEALERTGDIDAATHLRDLRSTDRAAADRVAALARGTPPERLATLRQALDDPDTSVRLAAIKALGRTRDPSVTRLLIERLQQESDSDVLPAIGTALSMLKEAGAVQEMLRLALHSSNTTVRAQMLVALAELLGGAGTFHKLWRQDRHLRGSGFAALTGRLRRQIRVLAHGHVTRIPRPRAERRQLLAEADAAVEQFLDQAQNEQWSAALDSLWQIALLLLTLRYGYQGDEAHAVEFLAAVAPGQDQRYLLIAALRQACDSREAPEAAWDGLSLLALYILVHGQPAV